MLRENDGRGATGNGGHTAPAMPSKGLRHKRCFPRQEGRESDGRELLSKRSSPMNLFPNLRWIPLCLFLLSQASPSLAAADESELKVPEKSQEDSVIREAVNSSLGRMRHANKEEREKALRELQSKLSSRWNADHVRAQPATRRIVAQELIRLYKESNEKDFSTPAVRQRILQTITLHGDDVVAKQFVLKILDKGTAIERREVLAVLGTGTVSGDDVYDKLEDMFRRGALDRSGRATMLARVSRQRALPEVLKEIKTTRDPQIFIYASRTLQDTYRRPEDYGLTLPKLVELGLQKRGSYKGGNGLFWINSSLLGTYLETAEGQDLRTALEVLVSDMALCKPVIVPSLISRLDTREASARVLIAKALQMAIEDTRTDSQVVTRALSSALEKESDVQARQALADAVKRVAAFGEERARAEQQANPGQRQ